MVIGLVRAAERMKSPAILQLFPLTLEYGGANGEFLQFCVEQWVFCFLPISSSSLLTLVSSVPPDDTLTASAHNAKVPIAVHLDHATSAEALEFAIGLAEKKGIKFDSIMVDASHADVSGGWACRAFCPNMYGRPENWTPQTEEENIAIAVPFIKRCNAQGISTEVELGRLEGGEAGVREITGEMLTDPSKAEVFMQRCV
jgi:fructose-bisphosphate aldolase class II